MSPFANQRRDERFKSDLIIRMGQGQGVVRDVSTASIYFITDVPLKAGQSFDFTLLFQNAPTAPISAHCTARVVRLEKRGGQNGVAASISNIALRRI
jgi:hypothetical protein